MYKFLKGYGIAVGFFLLLACAGTMVNKRVNNPAIEQFIKLTEKTTGYLLIPAYGTYRLARWTIQTGIPKLIDAVSDCIHYCIDFIDWAITRICQKIRYVLINVSRFIGKQLRKVLQFMIDVWDWAIRKLCRFLDIMF